GEIAFGGALRQSIEVAAERVGFVGRPASGPQLRRQARIVERDATKGVNEQAAHHESLLRICGRGELLDDGAKPGKEGPVFGCDPWEVPAVPNPRRQCRCARAGHIACSQDDELVRKAERDELTCEIGIRAVSQRSREEAWPERTEALPAELAPQVAPLRRR